MKKKSTFLVILLVLCLAPFGIKTAFSLQPEDINPLQTPRLLVAIDPNASFTAEDFASTSSAAYINMTARNPYKELQERFLEESFVAVPYVFTRPGPLRWLAARFGYRYVIFTDETLEEALATAQSMLEQIPTKTSQLQALTSSEATDLYTLMKGLHEVLSALDIHYWIGRETLLGAVRHGGLMPWDDYLYLYITEEEEKKLAGAPELFEAIGLEIHTYFKDFYKVSPVQGHTLYNDIDPNVTLPFRYPAANIFVMTLEKKGDLYRGEIDDTLVNKSYEFYSHWHQDRFDFSQIENIYPIKFGPLMINAPGNPESYLSRMYGTQKCPDLWKKYSFERPWDHRVEKLPTYKEAPSSKLIVSCRLLVSN